MLTYWPGTHVVHAAQVFWFAVVVYVPLAHDAHVRSVVAEPLETTRSPATHVDHAAHAVAEFPSLSQVVPLHATSGVVPPAQYVPAAQGAHVGGVVPEPGEVCFVPAAHAPCGRHELWLLALEYVPAAHAVQT